METVVKIEKSFLTEPDKNSIPVLILLKYF